MAKPNYSMAKRQRDLAKKAKAEEKRLRKIQAQESGQPVEADDEAEPGAETGAGGEAEAEDSSPPAEA